MPSTLIPGEGSGGNMGDRDRLQNGSEISEVGENFESLPCDGERLLESSKVFRMITFGSSCVLHSLLPADVGLFAAEPLHTLEG